MNQEIQRSREQEIKGYRDTEIKRFPFRLVSFSCSLVLLLSCSLVIAPVQAAGCNVGQCFSSKNNTSCPAGWQSVPGSCNTAYGPGFCCSEGSACPVGQCFADEYGTACPTGWTGYAGSCNTTSNPPKPGHCCQEGKEVSGGTGGGGGAASWNGGLGTGGAQTPATTGPPPGMTNLPCEATGDCQIKDLVAKAVMFAQFIMGLAGALFLFAFVYGGAMYIMSFGKPAMVDKGKKAMVQAAIGMVLILGAWTLVTYLVSSLGAKI